MNDPTPEELAGKARANVEEILERMDLPPHPSKWEVTHHEDTGNLELRYPGGACILRQVRYNKYVGGRMVPSRDKNRHSANMVRLARYLPNIFENILLAAFYLGHDDVEQGEAILGDMILEISIQTNLDYDDVRRALKTGRKVLKEDFQKARDAGFDFDYEKLTN